ncbi:MAG: hypothetical protein PHI27_01145 [Eubacteriales bacterium]|nr:hypothetical protein [Eubacteriales bacterium]MDD3880840.1 hypothetical protein [Eubacteriales bacterium]MDD4511793.1 hypothetical protein [Eubacteriales bacterium]
MLILGLVIGILSLVFTVVSAIIGFILPVFCLPVFGVIGLLLLLTGNRRGLRVLGVLLLLSLIF